MTLYLKILDQVPSAESGRTITPAQIARILGARQPSVRRTLQQYVSGGVVVRESRGRYRRA